MRRKFLSIKDPDARVYRPGWIGNVLIGGVAALVLWGLYGPMANAVVVGVAQTSAPAPLLRVAELFAAIVTGIGGSRVLTAEVDKFLLEDEKKHLVGAKDALAKAVDMLAQEARHG